MNASTNYLRQILGSALGTAIVLALARVHVHAPPRPTEDTCRAITRPGETWEDACERVYRIAPESWSVNDELQIR